MGAVAGCGQDSISTTVPTQVSQSQDAVVASVEPRSEEVAAQAESRVSAIFRANPSVVDLADVGLLLALLLSDAEEPSDRDLTAAADNLLPGTFSTEETFPGLDEISTDFVRGKSVGSSQPDLLDVAVVYAATVLPDLGNASGDERRAAIASIVNALVPGQDVEADDIAAIPPTVPTVQTSRDPGETVSTALFLGELFSQTIVINESVGFSDPSDLYRFELTRGTFVFARLDDPSTDGRLQIGRDLNGNDELDDGELIVDRDNGGVGEDELIVSNLDPGTYLIRVLPEGSAIAELSYELQVGAALLDPAFSQEPGNEPASALVLPELDLNPDDRVRVPTVFPGFTSPITDSADIYQLEVDRLINLRVLLEDVFTSDIGTVRGNIQLIRDLNDNGELDDNESLIESVSGNIIPDNNTGIDIALDPGTYFIQVDSLDLDDITATSYTLDIDGTIPEVNPLQDDPGSTPAEATIAPPLDPNPDNEARVPTTFRGFANTFADPEDYFQFELERISNVSIELDLSDLPSQRAIVQIVKDINQNGAFDPGEDLFEFARNASVALDPGTYFARVFPDPEFGLDTISYTLSIDAPVPETNALDRDPGNTLAEAAIVPPLDTNPDLSQREQTIYRGFVNAIADPDNFLSPRTRSRDQYCNCVNQPRTGRLCRWRDRTHSRCQRERHHRRWRRSARIRF
ncbi:MAG: hypothetical protein AAFX40_13130 [Cyanobacteria bacterium J06639_1]